MSNLADIFTKYKAVVFFDTETTGLDANACQIIELAAIRIEQTDRPAEKEIKLCIVGHQQHRPVSEHVGEACCSVGLAHAFGFQCKAMDNERADLLEYVNIFGYNPKYGVGGPRIDGVAARFSLFFMGAPPISFCLSD